MKKGRSNWDPSRTLDVILCFKSPVTAPHSSYFTVHSVLLSLINFFYYLFIVGSILLYKLVMNYLHYLQSYTHLFFWVYSWYLSKHSPKHRPGYRSRVSSSFVNFCNTPCSFFSSLNFWNLVHHFFLFCVHSGATFSETRFQSGCSGGAKDLELQPV